MHLSRQHNCWSLRCSWSIACRRCSNYIFILDLTPGFNGLGKDSGKTRWQTFKLRNLVWLILEVWQYWVCYYADYTLFMHTSLTTKSDGQRLTAVVCHMMDHVEVTWFIEMIKIFSFRDMMCLLLQFWQYWVRYYVDYTLFMHTSLTTKSDGHDWQLLSDTWWTTDHIEVIWFIEMIKNFSIHPTLNQYVSKMCYYTEMEMSFWKIFITGYTVSCQNDNFRCSQW